jgi:hypothetical protein
MTSRFWGIIPGKSEAAEGCFERPGMAEPRSWVTFRRVGRVGRSHAVRPLALARLSILLRNDERFMPGPFFTI